MFARKKGANPPSTAKRREILCIIAKPIDLSGHWGSFKGNRGKICLDNEGEYLELRTRALKERGEERHREFGWGGQLWNLTAGASVFLGRLWRQVHHGSKVNSTNEQHWLSWWLDQWSCWLSFCNPHSSFLLNWTKVYELWAANIYQEVPRANSVKRIKCQDWVHEHNIKIKLCCCPWLFSHSRLRKTSRMHLSLGHLVHRFVP